MNREKQSMSEIVYNYSKFRSMESHMNRVERSKKKTDKIILKEIVKDPTRFPDLKQSPQDIFTIDYDPDGKKIVKVDLKKFEENR
jgi:hypothetical protein